MVDAKSWQCLMQLWRALTMLILIAGLAMTGSSVTAGSLLAAAQPSLVVDLAQDQGPIRHAASGFTMGMSRANPPDDLVRPLKPKLFREASFSYNQDQPDGGWFGIVSRSASMGADYQFVISDAVDSTDYGDLDDAVDEFADTARSAGYHVQWDIWNEPLNADTLGSWSRFLEVWNHVYARLRSSLPNAVIVGPSTTGYDVAYLHSFVDNGVSHHSLPDILSWHELDNDGSLIPMHVQDLKQYLSNTYHMSEFNRFSINEIIGPSDQYSPGVAAIFFANIERTGVESAAHACWQDTGSGSNCENSSLAGLLTPGERRTRATWWAYKAYADVTGRRVGLSRSDDVDGVAGQDPNSATVSLILGRGSSGSAGDVAVTFTKLNAVAYLSGGGPIHVVADRIPYTSNGAPLASPTRVLDANVTASGAQLQISLPNFGPNDAYSVVLSGAAPGAAPAAPAAAPAAPAAAPAAPAAAPAAPAAAPAAPGAAPAAPGAAPAAPAAAPPIVSAVPQTGIPALVHDDRYFAETGFRIEDDSIWAYFLSRGRIATFGYPVSRTFQLLGCPVQMFQRVIAQVCSGGRPALLNLLDPEIFPYSVVNGSSLPGVDDQLKSETPKLEDPDYASRIVEFVLANAPDVFEGEPTNFGATFFGLITPGIAGASDPRQLGLLNLEIWGAPISRPQRDPANSAFVYQRFQRGIMLYAQGQGTQGILLSDYLKAIIRDRDVPSDLREESQSSRFVAQYCPGEIGWICRPAELPGSDLTYAFEAD